MPINKNNYSNKASPNLKNSVIKSSQCEGFLDYSSILISSVSVVIILATLSAKRSPLLLWNMF